MDKADITIDVVRALIEEQFPHWADLALRAVDVDGWDNTSFRLGDELLVRLPSHDRYVAGVEKEPQTGFKAPTQDRSSVRRAALPFSQL